MVGILGLVSRGVKVEDRKVSSVKRDDRGKEEYC